MNKIPENSIIVALDGDGVGRLVGRSVLANDISELHKISARIDAAQDFILHWAKQVDGIKISGGGDEAVLSVPKDEEPRVEGLRKDIERSFGYTLSVGIGSSLSEAGTALLVAKLRGKDRIVHFSKELEKEIKEAKKRVKKGKATQEEYKLAEAYLEKNEGSTVDKKSELEDCQYCAQVDDTDPDHCKYCHDNEPTSSEEKCPYCQDESDEGHLNEQKDRLESPDSSDASAPAGSKEEKEQANSMGMNPPVDSDPDAKEPVEPSAPTSPEHISPENAHSREVMEAIVEAIESQTADGHPDYAQADEMAQDIDDTDLANVNEESEENVSRPAGYESSTPGDMGLSEEEADQPDLGQVLQEGLDSHAESMQREKVIQLVSSALAGFKECKGILDKAKEQAPQLYNSSILMLKAMIEMAQMLGLGQNESSEDPLESEPVSPGDGSQDQGDEWKEPFAKHPDQGGERKPGHAASKEDAAQAPKTDRQ